MNNKKVTFFTRRDGKFEKMEQEFVIVGSESCDDTHPENYYG